MIPQILMQILSGVEEDKGVGVRERQREDKSTDKLFYSTPSI